VDERVIEVLKVEWFTAGSDVAITVPVRFEEAVDAGEKQIMSNIELSATV
jgi:hypothetical protein